MWLRFPETWLPDRVLWGNGARSGPGLAYLFRGPVMGRNLTVLFQYCCLYISSRKTGSLQGWLFPCLNQNPRLPGSYCSWSACRLPVHLLPACTMLRLTCRSRTRWWRRQMCTILLRWVIVSRNATGSTGLGQRRVFGWITIAWLSVSKNIITKIPDTTRYLLIFLTETWVEEFCDLFSCSRLKNAVFLKRWRKSPFSFHFTCSIERKNLTVLSQYWCLYISCRKTGLLQGGLSLCLKQDPRSPVSYCLCSASRLPVHSLPACTMLRLTCRSRIRWRRRLMRTILSRWMLVTRNATGSTGLGHGTVFIGIPFAKALVSINIWIRYRNQPDISSFYRRWIQETAIAAIRQRLAGPDQLEPIDGKNRLL